MLKRFSLLWGIAVFGVVTWSDYSAGDPPGKSMGLLAWCIAFAPWLISLVLRLVLIGPLAMLGARRGLPLPARPPYRRT